MKVHIKGWMHVMLAALAAVALAGVAGCSNGTMPLAATQVTLVASTTTTNLNGTVTLTATLRGAPSAIGVITFFDGTTSLQAVDITGQTVVTATVNSLTPGENSLTAVYDGDQQNAPSTSVPVMVNITVPTTTTISASPTLAAVGDSVTLTATVSAGNLSPTGSVTFTNGGTTLGTAPLTSVNGAQKAVLVTTTLPLGTNSVTASYPGSSFYLASASTATTVTIHPPLIQTTTALATSPTTTIASGTLVTLTATLTPASSGASAPSGTVTFMDGTRALGTAALVSNVATFQSKAFVVGSNSLTAVYSGDAIYNTSTSPAAALAMTAYTGATYTNPLSMNDPVTGHVYNCPDPAIIKSQTAGVDTWYAYCTGDAFNSADTIAGGALKNHLISIFSSPDLVNWTYVRDAFAAMPSWIQAGQELQTPAIKFINGAYNLYYEAPAVTASPNGSAIGVGTAATPAGPFTDSGGPVVGQQIACGGGCNRTVFSPEVIADGGGQLWIAYGGIFAGLSVRQLNSAGTVSNPATEINIAVDNYYTNPYILFKNGFFYEFATPAGACCSGAFSTYSVRVGRSTSITGPYLDAEGNDMNAFSNVASRFAPGGDTMLVMTGNDIVGPGSNVIFTDESGQDYILYSGVSKAQQYLPNVTGFTARQLMMDAVDWINGWPTTRSGAGPSDVTAPQPVPAAQPSATNGYVPPIFVPDAPGTAIAASSDDFNETTLSNQWTFLHVPPNFTMTGTAYAVQSVSQESVVAASMPNLPILAEPEPAGNYMMEVKLSTTVSPTAFFTTNPQAGIFIYSSDTNYLRLDEFPDFDTRQIEFLNQFGAGAFSFAPVGTPNFYASTYFRVVKRVGTGGAPDTYTSYSSLDGITYLRGPAWTASYGSTGKIGLFAGNTAGFTVSFDYIHVTTVTP